MSIKHSVFLLPLLLASCLVSAKSVSVFSGQKFKADIEYFCEEGEVSCNKLSLKSESRKNGTTIELKGKTININCPDVCDVKGYEFANGNYLYSFYPNETKEGYWDYIVTRNGKVISKDTGLME